MSRGIGLLVAMLLLLPQQNASAQVFFDVHDLSTIPGDFDVGQEGDFKIIDLDPIDVGNTSPSRFLVDLAGGISGLNFSVVEALGQIHIQGISQNLFPTVEIAAAGLSFDMSTGSFSGNLAAGTIFEVFHSTEFTLAPIAALPPPAVPIPINGLGETYSQNFDAALGGDGTLLGSTPMPPGWLTHTAGVENTTISTSFPDGGTVVAGSYNAGSGADRTLSTGNISNTDENNIQWLAEVTGTNTMRAVRLLYDIEAWSADAGNVDPGEAVYGVTLDVDSGGGFSTEVNFGTTTTGATLSPGSLDGNLAANRMSFDSGVVEVDVAASSQLRLSFDGQNQGATTGILYGVDNMVFRAVAPGDTDGNGLVNIADLLTLLAGNQFNQGPGAVTWDQGDFNDDDEFNVVDLLAMLSFLGGQFPSNPYASEDRSTINAPQLLVDSETGIVAIDYLGQDVVNIIVESAAGIFTDGESPSWNEPGEFVSDGDSLISNTTFSRTFSGTEDLGQIIGSQFLGGDFDFDADLTITVQTMTGDSLATGSFSNSGVIVVPEPSTLVFAVTAVLLLLCWGMHCQGQALRQKAEAGS